MNIQQKESYVAIGHTFDSCAGYATLFQIADCSQREPDTIVQNQMGISATKEKDVERRTPLVKF
jgi:hypothetical protein